MTTELDAEWLWGVHFHGRDFVIWYDSEEQAVWEAESVEDKHAPAELIRVPLAGVEHLDKFFYYSPRLGREWHYRAEAIEDGMLESERESAQP